MKQVPIKLGPLALLLTVISICLTTLAILTFTTARADRRLAEKYAETVSTRYSLEIRGQEFLGEAQAMAENGSFEFLDDLDRNGVYWETLEQGGSRLKIGVRQRGTDAEVLAWKHERLWEEDTSLNIWLGD